MTYPPDVFALATSTFLTCTLAVWGAALRQHHQALHGDQPTASQVHAWTHCFEVMQGTLAALTQRQPDVKAWTIVFEYELPRERGRRPDVLLLTSDRVLVLEFKDHPFPTPTQQAAHVDQVSAYARDLAHYHAASHGRQLVPILVYAGRSAVREQRGDVHLVSPEHLLSLLEAHAVSTDAPLDHVHWLAADYAPLPTLVSAARRLFNHEPLPAIRRAQSAGIQDTVAHLLDIAREAHRKGEHHLALVTGVPGAGKTLVGLQYVYANSIEEGEDARDAVFLSGNGPLMNVLQHALKTKVFVHGVHDFLKQYGGTRQRWPTEHIWVYDEAQRAWDAQQVQEKRGHATSEPEDFLRLGSTMTGWAMLVGLIGEGQEIHIGEEAGLTQWNDALASVNVPWVVHAPDKLASSFPNASRVHTSDRLDLTVSLRSHLAEDLQRCVQHLLSGNLKEAQDLLPRIQQQGFEVYITRDLDAAKTYVRERYEGMGDKRFGLLASSKASNLKRVGLDTWMQGVKHHKAGPWFNNPPTDPASCCQLTDIATEFVCQGLELDFPIVCWGHDLTWNGHAWQVRPSRPQAGRRAPVNPDFLRMNSYRVLLTRGRDGMVMYVPPHEVLHTTYTMFEDLGLPVI